MRVNHKKYQLMDYISNPSEDDKFKLGDVVFVPAFNTIGVIIQCHGNDEYRTDSDGNRCVSELKKARLSQINKLRPRLTLPNDCITGHPEYS